MSYRILYPAVEKNEKNLYMVSWKRGPSYTDK